MGNQKIALLKERLDIDLITMLTQLIPTYGTMFVIEYFPRHGTIAICWEHWKYLNPRAAHRVYLGTFNEPKMHSIQKNLYYITF